ncbi:BTAD domain-containing putative transcriptional regulator [Streptomyces sp. NPDC048337]|uniref:AfsR/SARP family transcriptional regulator n=1 Tax=Streptomyces sp. NPDC048337 TaxID=3365535 RepID=UPI0037207DC7
MELQILGPVEARRDGKRVALSGTKVNTVLATLLLARGRVVSDARLSYLLWGWNPPATMNAQIYTYVSRLRMQLGDGISIVRQQPGYAMHTGDAAIDFVEFERLARLGREALELGHHEEADGFLRGALELWRGPALSNVTEFLTDAELPQLEEARAAATENRIEADLALGRHQQIVPELTGLVSRFPVRERMRAQLMTALYRCGRQADALTTYHDGRKALAEELGVDPGEALAATYQRVLTGELEGAGEAVRVAVRAPAVHSAPPAMLPPDIADFTGREAELAELRRLLPAAEGARSWHARRFLITGMAGSGKTALAVRAANDCLEQFPDGQLYVNLSHSDGSPRDPREVLVRLLRALGDSLAADVGETDLDELIRLYRTRTSRKRLLILLDNVVSELQLGPLLPGAPEPAVLITSRTALGPVGGVHTLVLSPLGPEEGLRMLCAAVDPARIAAEPAAAREIARFCAGLPLAVRIAGNRLAARPQWSLAQLATRLADPAGRLAELQARGLSVPQSLSLSLRQLRPERRELLHRLPEIGGGTRSFSAARVADELGLAEAVVERGLEGLVDHGLLVVWDDGEPGVPPTYELHELVGLFARARAAAELVMG